MYLSPFFLLPLYVFTPQGLIVSSYSHFLDWYFALHCFKFSNLKLEILSFSPSLFQVHFALVKEPGVLKSGGGQNQQWHPGNYLQKLEKEYAQLRFSLRMQHQHQDSYFNLAQCKLGCYDRACCLQAGRSGGSSGWLLIGSGCLVCCMVWSALYSGQPLLLGQGHCSRTIIEASLIQLMKSWGEGSSGGFQTGPPYAAFFIQTFAWLLQPNSISVMTLAGQ